MRTILLPIFFVLALTSVATSAALSEAELKKLLVAIRQNRMTQADFQEERVMRLRKKPVVSPGTVWFQPPNKVRRKRKWKSPSSNVNRGRELCAYYARLKSV